MIPWDVVLQEQTVSAKVTYRLQFLPELWSHSGLLFMVPLPGNLCGVFHGLQCGHLLQCDPSWAVEEQLNSLWFCSQAAG